MLDHASISVNDYKESIKFYDETFEILGFKRIMTFETDEYNVAGYGLDGRPHFWVSTESKPNSQEFVGKGRGVHFAFKAPNAESVDKWYKKCLELGGNDNGAPGPRAQYHPGYYGAFIIDPNGWRIEAAIHDYK